MRIILVPGLLAAGIGTLVSIGMGSFTGLSSKNFALGPIPLTTAPHIKLGEFLWTIALAIAVAVVANVIVRGGRFTYATVSRRHRLLVLLPAIGLVIGGLAIAFSQITGKSVDQVLFSGESQLPGLVGQAGGWSIAALAWLIVFKGIGYSLSLGAYRGGPTFPAIFLGAAAGIMASHLPGFPIQAGVAVGIGAGTVSILKLPLSSVVLATLLCSHAGTNVEPLTIVGVVVAYIVTLVMGSLRASAHAPQSAPASEPAPAPAPAPTA